MLRAENKRADEFRKWSISSLGKKYCRTRHNYIFTLFFAGGWSASNTCLLSRTWPQHSQLSGTAVGRKLSRCSAFLGAWSSSPAEWSQQVTHPCWKQYIVLTSGWKSYQGLPHCRRDDGFEHCYHSANKRLIKNNSFLSTSNKNFSHILSDSC